MWLWFSSFIAILAAWAAMFGEWLALAWMWESGLPGFLVFILGIANFFALYFLLGAFCAAMWRGRIQHVGYAGIWVVMISLLPWAIATWGLAFFLLRPTTACFERGVEVGELWRSLTAWLSGDEREPPSPFPWKDGD